ncbi:MAG: DUF2505 family protein [bacterium]
MKFGMDHTFGWPLEKIAPLLAHEELVDFEDLPNVSKRKFLERRREGNKTIKVCEWNVHGQIPKAAQRVIRPEMLTFTERTVWDDDTCTFDSRIEPHFLKSIVTVATRSQWSAAGPDKTKRHIDTFLEVHIPLIGQIMEKTVADYLKKNTEKSTEVMKNVLTRRLGPQTA